MTRSNVEDHLGYEEGIITGCSVALGEMNHFFLESDQSPDSTGKYNAYAVTVHIIFGNGCIRYRLIANRQGGLRKAIQFPGFFFIQKTEGIIILQLAGKTGFEFCSIEKSY